MAALEELAKEVVLL